MDTGIKMVGMEEMLREMKKYPKKMERKGLRKATTAGSKVLVKAIKLVLKQSGKGVSAPGQPPGIHTGNLMKSTAYKMLRSRFPTEMTALIGHKAGSGKGAEKLGAHAHLLERGTENMAARPYFKPTFERKANEMTDTVARTLMGILYG